MLKCLIRTLGSARIRTGANSSPEHRRVARWCGRARSCCRWSWRLPARRSRRHPEGIRPECLFWRSGTRLRASDEPYPTWWFAVSPRSLRAAALTCTTRPRHFLPEIAKKSTIAIRLTNERISSTNLTGRIWDTLLPNIRPIVCSVGRDECG